MPALTIPTQGSRFLALPALHLFAALLFATNAPAQELAQLRLEGAIPADRAGMLVISAEGMVREDARKVELELFLAPGTTGSEAAGIVAERLTRAGFDVIRPGTLVGSSGASFLIEDALRLAVQVPFGMKASFASPSSAPAYFEIVAELEEDDSIEIQFSSAFRLPVKRGVSQITFTATLEGPRHPTQMVESLSTQALKHGLRSERPGSTSWRPLSTVKSNDCVGFCATWDGRPGWGAVLGLADHR